MLPTAPGAAGRPGGRSPGRAPRPAPVMDRSAGDRPHRELPPTARSRSSHSLRRTLWVRIAARLALSARRSRSRLRRLRAQGRSSRPYVRAGGPSRPGDPGRKGKSGGRWCGVSYRPAPGAPSAVAVMPCRGGGARSTTRPSESGDRHCTIARAEGMGKLRRLSRCWETGALAAELRACGRRDRDRTDGLLRFRQALYAC